MKRIVGLLGVGLLLLFAAGCEVEQPYGAGYGVYGEYPTYYGGYAYPAYPYYGHPYDRDHYWDRDRYWERGRWHHRDWD